MPGSSRIISRRALLAGAGALGFAAGQPETIAFDLSLLDAAAVPNELFFLREHFPQPVGLSSASWKVAVSGAVAVPLELNFDDLVALPGRSLPVTIECAENPVGGGLVSHAVWAGCSLPALLERAKPAGLEARFVRLAGADGFSQTVPFAKAMHPDSLLAYAMNGEKLPVGHGFPVRAIVPGWYGMASIKWLQRIEILSQEPPAQEYRRQSRSLLAGVRDEGAIGAGAVKAVFTRPVDGAILTRRGRFLLRGVAWAGEQRVRAVEVSADGTKTWLTARLEDEALPYCWVRWSCEWTPPGAGEVELVVRATDDRGVSQPAERAASRADSYEWNSWQSIRVTAG